MFVGGGEKKDNILNVSKNSHVIVGTPGKIKGILKNPRFKPKLSLKNVKYFVADEADDLMELTEQNKKNYNDVMTIIKKIDPKAQVNFFSATFP